MLIGTPLVLNPICACRAIKGLTIFSFLVLEKWSPYQNLQFPSISYIASSSIIAPGERTLVKSDMLA